MNGSSKLVLGTVQFGCQYGINSAGRPTQAMVEDILRTAAAAGISTLDTSSAYGESEQVLGAAHASGEFRIVSKYPKGATPVREMFGGTLERLGTGSLYGYLLHHFDVYRANKGVWDEFRRLRDAGMTQRIGFSLYSPEELEMLLEDGVDFNLLQVPRNILDRKFDPYLPVLQARGVEVHVRSTFLQGLFFKDRNTLPEKMQPLRKYLLELDEFAAASGHSLEEIALGFNITNPCIAGVLIGVDNVAQLTANVAAASHVPDDGYPVFDVAEQELLNPVNWK